MVATQYKPTGTRHIVYAEGSPLDGSLYGFPTLCGMEIKDMSMWVEGEDNDPMGATCGSCRRIAGRLPFEPERLFWPDGTPSGARGQGAE